MIACAYACLLRGAIEIRLRERSVSLGEGEFLDSPKADALAEVLLFEPAATRNTGNVEHAYTIEADALETI